MKKNRVFRALLVIAFMVLCPLLRAQVPVEMSTEIVKIGGKEYYMHRVTQGQTLYGISQAYQVSVEDIEKLNPEVKNGLKTGYVIGIPVKKKDPEPAQEKIEPQNIVPDQKEEPTSSVVEEPTPSVVEEPQPSQDEAPSALAVGGSYVVQPGENLYDIAKKFGIDLADFKAINPGLTNEPRAGMTIMVPDIVNENDYIVHKVEFNERTTSMLNRWNVSEDEFREKNVSVGSHVFVNQVVLIPIDPVSIVKVPEAMVLENNENENKAEEEETPASNELEVYDYEEPIENPECKGDPANASKMYKVALMIPLYLHDLARLEVNKENVAQVRKSRALAFVQYYEGFMMAVERLTQEEGLNLDLTVIDVTDNELTAHDAISQIEGKELDLIIGPFFSKSFEIVLEYARDKGIIMVNPLSTRESIIEGNDHVVKVKPNVHGQILGVSNLVKNRYSDSNVFIISRETPSDSLFLNQLEYQLNKYVKEDVTVTNEEMLEYARSESERMEMGSRLVSTVTIEGQVYSTDDLRSYDGSVVLENPVKRYNYSTDLSTMKSNLSGVRNNLIIAYGDSNVFATQILNTLKKDTEKNPITLLALPDWTGFEKLLVENLLQMNAIYLTDGFVDYNDQEVKHFVRRFRAQYESEPQAYAFEGYDIGWYFLNALMRFGTDMLGCLPYYDLPLLHTRYYFMNKSREDGLENQYWSMYQYDNELIELKPINPFKKAEE